MGGWSFSSAMLWTVFSISQSRYDIHNHDVIHCKGSIDYQPRSLDGIPYSALFSRH